MDHSSLSVVAILKLVDHIGYVIQPYLYLSDDTAPFIVVEERITNLSISSYEVLPSGAKELFKISQTLEPSSLVNRFTKKATTIKDLYTNTTLTEEVIKPFIDRKISESIEIINMHDITLYPAASLPHLYPSEKIKVIKSKATTNLLFNRTDENTLYTLEAFSAGEKLNLLHESTAILTNNPCYIIHKNRVLGFDKNINGKLITPFLTRTNIVIPKRIEHKYFTGFIRKIINSSQVHATGFLIEDIVLVPQAYISIDMDWTGKLCLVLEFRYGERIVFPNNKNDSFTDLTTDENSITFRRFSRNRVLESEYIDFLLKNGLHVHENCFSMPENIDFAMIDWFLEHKDSLLNKGYNISHEFIERYVVEHPSLSCHIEDTNDWFDLNITVTIGDLSLPFLKFRNHILHNERVYLLPNGRKFIIPQEWFERFHDLMVHTDDKNGRLTLGRYHYGLLLSIAKDISTTTNIDLSDFKNDTLNEDQPIVPALNNVQLRPYQITGYQWLIYLMRRGFGGILADDMGLGKTLQMITYLAAYYPYHPDKEDLHFEFPIINNHEEQSNVASLIVLPASLIHNWINELKKFAPWITYLVYTGTRRKKSNRVLSKYNIIVTTYGTVRNDCAFLAGYEFANIILDESQYIKNPSSKTSQAVFDLSGKHKFALTGTPLENSLTDIWSQMNFLNRGLLGSQAKFYSYYANPLFKNPDAPEGQKLLSILQPFILRRTKEAVAPELPDLLTTISQCTMPEDQSAFYEKEKSKIRNLVLEQLEKGTSNETPVMVLKALMQLRQIANHPKLVGASDISSGKFEEVTNKLDTIIAGRHKVLVFSSFVKHLNLIAEYCSEKGYPYSMLTGSTIDREKVVGEFKSNNNTQIFLISLKAGGVGLNLFEADYVFILDPWWNPAAEQQAINRAHRIGQTRKVFVYRFITINSIEEKIQHLQKHKKTLADAFIKPQSTIAAMSKDEISKLFN